ncbi:MAG: acetolactate synthase [Lachnospiraceae bacterium]|nr:acetolactate synthase [Robinsoniella sp.]MDY3765631.1 acetolactate synthase [Lachnospiraceae bacterium]
MTVKQISVFLENQPGKLAEFAAVLSAQKINLRAISVAEAADFGIVRIIVDDVFNAVTVLKSENYICSITDVLAVEVQDEAGMLANMIGVLGAEGINIEYMYTILGKKSNVAYMIIRTNVDARAEKILEAKGFKIVDLEAMK